MTTWYYVLLVRAVLDGKYKPALLLVFNIIVFRILRSRLQIINFAMLNGLSTPNVVNDGTTVLTIHVFMASTATTLASIASFTAVFVVLVQTTAVGNRKCSSVLIVSSGVSLLWLKGGTGEYEVIVSRFVCFCVCGLVVCTWICKESEGREILVSITSTILFTLLLRGSVTLILCLMVFSSLLSFRHLMKDDSSSSSSVLRFMFLMGVGECYFFVVGNSHALATMDISGAYTGLSEYVFIVVFVLTGFILFAGQLISIVLPMVLEVDNDIGISKRLWIFQLIHSFRIWLFCINLSVMKSHLFIWTVFAPKWVYEVLHMLMVIVVSHLML